MVYIIKTINGIRKKIKVAGFAMGGNPVGSMLTTFKKVKPTNYLYCDGSTFDENQYPALYLYLGTNVLPDYRECVMVGAEKNTTDIFDSTETDPSTGQAGTQAHDVFSQGEFKDDQIQNIVGNEGAILAEGSKSGPFYVTQTGMSCSGLIYGHADGYGQQTRFDASRVVRAGTTTRTKEKAVFVYIKAVDGVDIADEDYFLDTVKNFVEEKNSYSTEEMLTGGKWIDGKPIYRKCFDTRFLASTSLIDVANLNIDYVVHLEAIVVASNGNRVSVNPSYYDGSAIVGIYFSGSTNKICAFNNSADFNNLPSTVIFEYTKTTD